jgi:hypothetical protein
MHKDVMYYIGGSYAILRAGRLIRAEFNLSR